MAAEIPGYYYDPDKRKYFKIEKSQTAPASASWSSQAVKRRKTEAAVREDAENRKMALKRHVRRNEGLKRAGYLSGVMDREIGGDLDVRSGSGGARGVGSRPSDVGVEAWAGGLVDMGAIDFLEDIGRQTSDRRMLENQSCLWAGRGVAFTTIGNSLLASYAPTDEDGVISFDREAPLESPRAVGIFDMPWLNPETNSIKYHEPSERLLVTARKDEESVGELIPREGRGLTEDGQLVLSGHYTIKGRFLPGERTGEWQVNNNTPAPSSSSILCLVATNLGVVSMSSQGHSHTLLRPSPSDSHSNKHPRSSSPKEIFDVDFKTNHSDVIYAGGRQPKLWTMDLRTPSQGWSSTPHGSSIAKLKSVNEHQVLACGPRSQMSLYDVRFAKQKPNGARPLVMFPEYKNEEHIHVGFDVSTRMGAVVAAQDDGSVGVFSLESGRRMRCKVLEGLSASPIKSLMFEKGIEEEVLWIARGGSACKFGFGRGTIEEW